MSEQCDFGLIGLILVVRLMPKLLAGDPGLLATEPGQRWYKALTSGDKALMFDTAMEIVASLQQEEPPLAADKVTRDAWDRYTALADEYNELGL